MNVAIRRRNFRVTNGIASKNTWIVLGLNHSRRPEEALPILQLLYIQRGEDQLVLGAT